MIIKWFNKEKYIRIIKVKIIIIKNVNIKNKLIIN